MTNTEISPGTSQVAGRQTVLRSKNLTWVTFDRSGIDAQCDDLRLRELASRVESQLGLALKSYCLRAFDNSALQDLSLAIPASGIAVVDLADFNSLKRLVSSYKSDASQLLIVTPLVSEEEFQSREYKSIVKKCEEAGIFLTYPDAKSGPILYVSLEKLSDTVTCHIHRPKFRSVRVEAPAALRGRENLLSRWFESLRDQGRWLAAKGMLTDPFDGTITLRSTRGMVTLASRTKKSDIQPDDFVWVRAVDPVMNRVEYVGPRIPSSDSLCDAILLSKRKTVNAMVHTHCKPITYAPNLSAFRTSGYAPYGTVDLARNVLAVTQTDGNFVVMAGHGETAMAGTLQSCSEILETNLRRAVS